MKDEYDCIFKDSLHAICLYTTHTNHGHNVVKPSMFHTSCLILRKYPHWFSLLMACHEVFYVTLLPMTTKTNLFHLPHQLDPTIWPLSMK